jgi:methylmalonyl-CoA/ethylmalonyl-CoA epimerase
MDDDIGVLRLDHVGVAVPDLDEAIERYRRVLGLRVVHTETNHDQGVREAMLAGGEGAYLQLLAPLTPDSPIGRFLDRRGPGLQQVAYAVRDLDVACRRLRERGVRLVYESPKPGTSGTRVNFIYPAETGGVLVELVEHPA